VVRLREQLAHAVCFLFSGVCAAGVGIPCTFVQEDNARSVSGCV
jgi:hypothetical protein